MTTVHNALMIDAEGLDRLSCNAKADPGTGIKVVKAKTVCESGFRNMTYVRDLAPEKSAGALSLEVKVDDGDPAAPVITSWLAQLAATGVQVARSRRALAR